MNRTEQRNLAKSVLRKLGVGSTESQEDSVISIIEVLESFGAIDTARVVDIGSHGPIGIHIREGD